MRRRALSNTGLMETPHDGAWQTRAAVRERGALQNGILCCTQRTARSDVMAAGFSEDQHKVCGSGYWLSEDVLSDVLRLTSFASG